MESYRLERTRSVSLRDVASLDVVAREQLVETIRLHDPELGNDVGRAAAVLRERLGYGEDDTIDLYGILRAGEPSASYEMWAVDDESGIVFVAGTSEPTAVHVQQRHFWSVDPVDADAVALAAALNASRVWR